MTQWVSVKKHLPPYIDGEECTHDVLVWFSSGDCNYDIAFYDKGMDQWGLPNRSFKWANAWPDYWRRLPDSPLESK